MNSYPKTPTPGRFLPSKRLTQFSSQTPGPPRFTPTPRFGSSASRPTQSTSADAIEDDEDSQTSSDREQAQHDADANANADADAQGDEDEDEDEFEDEDEDGDGSSEGGIRARAKGRSMADAIDAEADWFARPARGVAPWMHSDALESETGEWEMEREAKRRRMGSRSPSVVHDSPVAGQDEEDEGEEVEEVEEEDEREDGIVPMSSLVEGMSMDGSQDVLGDGRMDGKMAIQPVFQTAPRFKPVGAGVEEDGDGLPVGVFSPRRRGEKYVAGGLAARLQGWLSEVKGWEDGADEDATSLARASSLRVHVEQVRSGNRMCLVEGRTGVSEGEPLRRFVLAGEGRIQGLERRARVSPGSVVVVGRPMWDIELDGRDWTVVSDWAVE